MILSWILLILSLLGYLALIILHLKKRGSAKLDAAVHFAQAALWLLFSESVSRSMRLASALRNCPGVSELFR